MAYDPGAIDATLAAAVGDEPALIAELREAFLDGVPARPRWPRAGAGRATIGASPPLRLKGLAASFGAIRLMALASEAFEGTPHDPVLIRKLRRAVARL